MGAERAKHACAHSKAMEQQISDTHTHTPESRQSLLRKADVTMIYFSLLLLPSFGSVT